MALVDRDASAADVLIADLLKQPRPVSDLENAILLHRRVDLRNEYAKAIRDAAQAYEDSKQFPERISDFRREQARVENWSSKLREWEESVGKGGAGTETGRALAARRMLANEDFTLNPCNPAPCRPWFRPLPPDEAAKELAELKKVAADYKAKSDALEKRIAEADKKVEQIEAQRVIERAQSQAAAKPPALTSSRSPNRLSLLGINVLMPPAPGSKSAWAACPLAWTRLSLSTSPKSAYPTLAMSVSTSPSGRPR